jgi:hypothetical protein
LTLLNADEVLTAATLTATRIEQQTDSDAERITAAYRAIVGRSPTTNERALSVDFLNRASLKELCRALFNLNAFVYVE